MRFLPLKQVEVADSAEQAYDEWLSAIDRALADPDTDRNELCRRVLTELYFPHLADADASSLPLGSRIALLQMDPRNVTLEPEYYAEIDRERYARVKPLLWLWEMFDKSVLGENIELGVRFRRVLAPYVFKRCGRNFKCFQFVKFSYGYNMEVGDDVVIHRYVLLDDRGGIVIGNKASVSDFANIYSHSHSLADGRDVNTPTTTIGDGVRITYHATVLAGAHLEPDAMLGAMALATRPVPSGKVALGIPAKPIIDKPPKDERPAHPPTTDPLAGA